jgi:hypothetical protein
MADGTLDSQVGARIRNGLGIMRTCLETATLEQIDDRLARGSQALWRHVKQSTASPSALTNWRHEWGRIVARYISLLAIPQKRQQSSIDTSSSFRGIGCAK